jgi:hypothetical protein
VLCMTSSTRIPRPVVGVYSLRTFIATHNPHVTALGQPGLTAN